VPDPVMDVTLSGEEAGGATGCREPGELLSLGRCIFNRVARGEHLFRDEG
jgi:hypothetical protein